MRIVFILPGYPWRPVGGFRVVYEYANGLVARGHDLAVVHPRNLRNWSPPPAHGSARLRRLAGRARNALFRPGVRWNPIDSRVRMLYVADPATERIPDADAVVATAWQTAEYVAGYPASKGRKFYLIQHYETWSGPRERVDATWRAPMKKIVIARWLAAKGLELGVPAEDMVHIPNGIDHTRFRPVRPLDRRPSRAAMLWSPLEWKGAGHGLRAMELARAERPGLEAILFGTGPTPGGLPAWAPYFRDPPQRDLVERIYNGSGIYLCPSLAEGWALPPAEAMACGCALVASDIGGVRDYADDEVTALLSPAGQPEAMAANILRLTADDGLRRRLAEAGRQRIADFTWPKSTDLLEAELTALR
ncbi:MAG: glycosyltransferase family 4 protein [bacterium]